MSLITCQSEGATPYHDGFNASVCSPNPASDIGETEVVEFLLPTQVNIGKKLIPDLCGHGKFRGGLAVGLLQFTNKPGKSLIINAFAATDGMGGCAIGRCGGYPASNDVVIFAHGTNIREILEKGGTYPRDFVEMNQWIEEGTLKVESVDAFKGPTPVSRVEMVTCLPQLQVEEADGVSSPLHSMKFYRTSVNSLREVRL